MASASFQLKATDETAQAFASVQNKLTKMHATAKQVGVGMATFFGFGAVVGGVKRLDAFMSEAETKAKQLGLTAEEINNLTIATGAADKAVNFLQSTLARFAGNIASVFVGGDAALKATEIRTFRVADALKLANEEAENLAQELENIGMGEEKGIALDRKRIEQIRARAEAIKETDPAKHDEEMNRAMRMEIQTTNKVFSAYEQYRKGVDDVGDAMQELEDKQLTAKETQAKIVEQILTLTKAVTLFGNALPEDFDPLNATDDQIQSVYTLITLEKELAGLIKKRQIEETFFQKISKDTGDIISSSFEDAIFSGQKLGEVIRSLTLDLARMVFNKTVTAPLAEGISDALFKMGRAGGGPVGAGNAYVVGEKGPELFVPSSSGSIIPNGGGSGGRSGGSSINVTYNIASGVSRSDLAPILEQERKRLKAEIPDMVRRGGSYRAAFA